MGREEGTVRGRKGWTEERIQREKERRGKREGDKWGV